MIKVLGLFAVLTFSVFAGYLYWNSRQWDSQSMPESYRVLDDLETKGLFQGQEIEFLDIDGQSLRLSQLKGKILVFSFWATWCEPCVDEFPSLIKLLDEFPEKVVLLAISHDEEVKDVREFVSAFKGFR